MSVLNSTNERGGGALPFVVAAILTLGAIFVFKGPAIDLWPDKVQPEAITPRTQQPAPNPDPAGPQKNPENRPEGQPQPSADGSGKGPRIPDCPELFTTYMKTKWIYKGAPVFQIFKNGKAVGYIHRDKKWENNPRGGEECAIFEVYKADKSPLAEINCDCKETDRANSVKNHKPLPF